MNDTQTDIEETAVSVKGASNQNPPESKLLRVVLVFSAIAAVIGVTLPAIANLKLGSDKAKSPVSIEAKAPETRVGTLSTEKYLEAFAWVARGRLEDLGIHHSLTVNAAGPNHIEITGQITEQQSGRYEVFKSWFKKQENYPELRDKVEKVEVFGLLPGVKSVWLGEKLMAFFDDGSSGGIGERIGENWEIVDIDQAEIILQRDGTIIAMEY